MHFHHLHFYVTDAAFWRDWFVHKLAFHDLQIASCLSSDPDKCPERSANPSPQAMAEERLVQAGIDIRVSDPERSPAAAAYLQRHPPGIGDVAFASERFEADLSRAIAQGAELLGEGVSINADGQRQCQLQGWAELRHTLVEVSPQWIVSRQPCPQHSQNAAWLSAIDHVVINVPNGELTAALAWYQRVFGLEGGQRFDIETARSGLRSQVLIHPQGTLQLPINEPSSANSQIQEFLHHNQGAGVQHVALRSHNAVGAIAHFRQQGLALIDVPQSYYDGLQQRSDCPISDTSEASRQQLLLDWAKGGQHGLLMQTFTKPIFAEPTFFFEIIERGIYTERGQHKRAQGFGEGNFRALFEAIERTQLERGSLI